MRQLITILLIVPAIVFAKDEEQDTILVHKEQVINDILNKLRNAPDDATREMHNEDLQAELESILENPGVMDYPFDMWTTMSTIKAPDGAFRIFNWNVEDEQLTHTHYCYLVRPVRGKKFLRVYKFVEDKISLPPRPTNTLTPNNWYGALYYKIIPVQKGSRTYYTMIGFSGEDRVTNQKLLDVFYFKGKTLRLGYPMFQQGKDAKGLARRVFFQYSEKAVVTVNQNDKLGGIVFDHLVPEQKNLEGMYDFYIPDMTYDCYRWNNTYWEYHEDVVAYNDENKKIRQWRPVEDGENSDFQEVKDFWINPVDPNSPVNSGTDATAPVEDYRDKEQKKNGKKKSKDGRRKFKLFRRKKKNKPHSAIGND